VDPVGDQRDAPEVEACNCLPYPYPEEEEDGYPKQDLLLFQVPVLPFRYG
jgi:hypothetical protein